MAKIYNLDLDVVGLGFLGWTKAELKQLATPFDVIIKREYDNEADSNAILVIVKDVVTELGYLRRHTAGIISPHLDAKTLRLRRGVCTKIDAVHGEASCTFTFQDVIKKTPAKPKVQAKI